MRDFLQLFLFFPLFFNSQKLYSYIANFNASLRPENVNGLTASFQFEMHHYSLVKLNHKVTLQGGDLFLLNARSLIRSKKIFQTK